LRWRVSREAKWVAPASRAAAHMDQINLKTEIGQDLQD